MKIGKILAKIGSAVVREAFPVGGNAIIDLANTFLPVGKKLDPGSTGDQVLDSISSLPPEELGKILTKEIDAREEDIRQSHHSLQAMLSAEERSNHSTRPYIAKHSFHLVVIESLIFSCSYVYAVIKGDPTLIDELNSSWTVVGALVGIPSGLLYAYFGILKQEHQNRLNAANGKPAISGIFAALMSRRK